jgi:DNA-binding transcriptional MerR regulator
MANASDELISTGGLAARVGRSPSTIKFWESEGVIPQAIRIEGSNRRAWWVSDVDLIQERIAARGRQHEGPESA